jgi:fructose-1,6-bisphosphatase/sedoheptulose 1,7-bisphosphatase-like protein
MNKENLKQLSNSLRAQLSNLPRTVISRIPHSSLIDTLNSLDKEIESIKDPIVKSTTKKTSTKKKSTSSK